MPTHKGRPWRTGGELDKYLSEIASVSIPDETEVAALVGTVRDGSASRTKRLAARNRLVEGNLRLVVSVARLYRNMGLSLSDLIAEGNIGLMRAVRGYDLNRGTKFSSYAPFWIRAAIRQAISRQTRQVRLPDYMHWLIRRVDKTRTELTGQLGRSPTLDEIRNELKVPITRAQFLEEALAAADACRAQLVPGRVGVVEEAGSADPGPDDTAQRKDGVEWLRKLMRRLPKRHARILRRRMADEIPLSKIGREMKLTRERVRQIATEAVAMLRAAAHGGSMASASRAVRADRKRRQLERHSDGPRPEGEPDGDTLDADALLRQLDVPLTDKDGAE